MRARPPSRGLMNELNPPSSARGLEQFAWLMDRAFRIPGTPIRVGLDAIIGLIPGGGDVVTGLIQAGIVLVAMFHYRVPKAVAIRMVSNVLLDVAVGSIPLVGDAFDVFFKANTRNLKLLGEVEQARARKQEYSSTSSILVLLGIAAGFLLLLGLMLIGLVAVVLWLLSLRHDVVR